MLFFFSLLGGGDLSTPAVSLVFYVPQLVTPQHKSVIVCTISASGWACLSLKAGPPLYTTTAAAAAAYT